MKQVKLDDLDLRDQEVIKEYCSRHSGVVIDDFNFNQWQYKIRLLSELSRKPIPALWFSSNYDHITTSFD